MNISWTGLAFTGAQKELDQWPVFLELVHLMPCTSLQISFISPDVPSNLDGKRKIFTKQQGSNKLTDAVQTTCISSDCEAVLASDAAMLNSSCCLSHGGQKQHSSKLYSPRDDTNGMNSVVWSAESERPAAKAAAQMAQPANSADTISQTLQLSFHTGCYHDVAGDIQQESRRPDLVFGANAGVLAKPDPAVYLRIHSCYTHAIPMRSMLLAGLCQIMHETALAYCVHKCCVSGVKPVI